MFTIEDMPVTPLPVLPASREGGQEEVPDSNSGWVHGTESFATSDGPGLRYVVYLQGCPLRCLYCHNPDARTPRRGTKRTVAELMEEIHRGDSFYRSPHGGVTLSGGEPLVQPEFAAALLRACHEDGFHTALDTSGYASRDAAAPVLKYTDLVLLDIKSWEWDTHRKVTGVDPLRIRFFAQNLAAMGKPVWVRFVLIPGLTDAPENIEGIAYFAASLGNVERVDILPFHKMGEPKWERLHLDYQLKETPPPTDEQIASAVAIFRSYGLNAI